MKASQNEARQGAAASPLALLTAKRITALTDAASTIFNTFYEIEKQQREEAQPRLAAALRSLDLFGPGEHYADDREGYVPGGDTA